MKKRIFILALMIALIATVFAISVSAKTSMSTVTFSQSFSEPITSADIPAPSVLTGTSARVVFDDGKTYPAYYIVKDQTEFATDYTAINEAFGTNYGDANIVRIEIPEGVTAIATDAYFKNASKMSKCEEVVLPDTITSLASYVFAYNSVIKSVTMSANATQIPNQMFERANGLLEFNVPENNSITYVGLHAFGYSGGGKPQIARIENLVNVTEIRYNAFIDCYTLEYLELGDVVKKIEYNAFAGCKKLVLANPLPSTLESVGTDAFKNCQSITSLIFPEGCTVPLSRYQFENCYKLETLIIHNTNDTEIGEGLISNCTSLKTLKLPLSGITSIVQKAFQNTGLEFLDLSEATQVTSLPNHVFASNTSLEVLVLPPNITSLGNYCAEKCTSLTEVWMPSTAKITFGQEVFGQCGWNREVNFYFPNSCEITYTNSSNKDDPFMTAHSGGSNNTTILYNVPLTTKCDKIYLGHTKPANITSCLVGGNCSVCSTAFEPYATEHTKGAETLTFPNGLTANGIYTYDCTNPGCTVADILAGDEQGRDVVAPVFVAKGYSTNADKNAINGGYFVELKSLELYERLIGELNYGIVIANANAFGANGFFNAENKVNTDKALQVEMDKQYASFDCSVNFGAKTNIELDLVICAYVIDANGVTFIQAESGSDVTIGGSAFKSVTLAQVVALQPAVSKED